MAGTTSSRRSSSTAKNSRAAAGCGPSGSRPGKPQAATCPLRTDFLGPVGRYDFYSPSVNLVFHHYGRAGLPKMFDEDWATRFPKVVRSAERVKAILGLQHESDDYDRTEMGKYGVGRRRTVQQFLRWAGIDLDAQTGKNLCDDRDVPWVPPNPPW